MNINKDSQLACPKCSTTMEGGRLLNNGMVWTGKKYDDVYEKNVKGCEALPAYGVIAMRCPNCNLIELYTSEEEQA